jgi:phenylalanyl-tRNA synthetase beta chain
MRVSYGWLRELLPDLTATPGEVAERLTNAGLEVEALLPFGSALEQVLVAEVKKVEPHPKRNNLSLVTVDRGGVEQSVVCGAPNVPGPGGRVALAPLGATLPAIGAPLAAREIGGVLSEGMLCSEVELGVGHDSSGILILEPGLGAPGVSLSKVVPQAHDTIFEIGVTPNRPDALSHVGVARELGALFGLRFEPPDPGSPRRSSDARLADLIAVDNQDVERCPHYGAGAVLEVTIAPSPAWLRFRLHALGVRAISNVVDITNLLLFEFGQPLHAFDLDRVRGARIVVRRARPGEPFTTLDGVARTLDTDDLVIGDGEGPSALAGVMGGQDSEIRSTTRRVLIECAYFSPRGVRRTARRHGLHTESSYRFERGVDWGAVPRVLERAKVLLTELAGGAAVAGAIHAKGPDCEPPRIGLRSSRLNKLLGVSVPFEEATAILSRLGLAVGEVSEQGGDRIAEVRGASFRPDISREVDLIEEVARVRGLDQIPTVLPAVAPQRPRPTGRLEQDVAREAVTLGFSEALTYSFVSPRELEQARAQKATVTLMNPLSEERSVMRTTLLPGLLDALRRARRHGERAVRLFTVGPRFLPPTAVEPAGEAALARPPRPEDRGVLPEERPCFAALISGPRTAHLSKPEEVDVYDAKGLALELVERLTGRRASVRSAFGDPLAAHLHPRGAAELRVGDTQLGRLGPLHPDVLDAFDLDASAQVIELDLAQIERLGSTLPRYRPIPRLPAVGRDISLVVKDEVLAGDVEAAISAAAGELCESVELFDLFRGESVPEGHRALGFHVVYRDPKAATDPDKARTLTDEEVDRRHEQVRRLAAEKFRATLRG